MPISKAKQNANRKWNENNLDRIYITVRKGQKEVIKKAAECQNLSINSYINKAIQEQLEKDKGQT